MCPQPEPGHIDLHHPPACKERPVSSVCEICGKGPGFGNNVSFSHRRTPRRFNPNIQIMRTRTGGNSRRVRVCTSCIKAGKVTR
jgi:large subunit ribosomal protein L28